MPMPLGATITGYADDLALTVTARKVKDLEDTANVAKTAEKAGKVLANLCRLMPNVGGPRERSRRMLWTVMKSIIMYGAFIWGKAVTKEVHRKALRSVQRKTAIRVVTTQNVLTKPPQIDIRKLENKRTKAKNHYDKQAHAKPTFKEGDSIILKKEKHRIAAQVMEKTDSPRSYIVKDHLGNIYRRNSYFLKPSKTDSPRSYIVKDHLGNIYRRNSYFLKPSPNPFILENDAQAEYEDITNQSNSAHKPSPNPFILENDAQAEYEDITNQSNSAHNSFATNDANNYDTPTTEIITESITLLQPMMLIITTLLLLR
ncbi:hypothetical protein QE152_g19965 [Popillia japonica]|uniref:Reverse transcriptase domain-containing protein n=1 Tax=Popillia japonica TaxID=7064 RepID=A0AAW1KP71_POPJA